MKIPLRSRGRSALRIYRWPRGHGKWKRADGEVAWCGAQKHRGVVTAWFGRTQIEVDW